MRDESGAVQAGVLVLHDVTEERCREAEFRRVATELHDRAQLMDTVFEHMSDGIVVADLTGRLTLFNEGARRLLGLGYLDVPAGERPGRYGFFHPDRVTRFAEEDLPLVRAVRGEATDGVEMFVRNADVPDGVFVSVEGRPLRNRAGELTGGIAVVRDVTQRAAAEEALTQAFSNGRLEVVDTLVHNIGNAMNSVTVGTETLRGELRQNALIGRLSALADAVEAHRDDPIAWVRDDPQGRKALPFVVALARDFAAHYDRLLQTADRVHDRVRHIVDIIRTQESQSLGGGGDLKAVELRQQIGDACRCCATPSPGAASASKSTARGCRARSGSTRAGSSRCWSTCSGTRWRRWTCGRPGAGSMPARRPSSRSPPTSEAANVVIDVIDNGVGIPPDRLRSIFAAGYTTKAAGSGLGLHSAANFVVGTAGASGR